jgi:phosphatidylglycerophosphatase A
MSDLCLDFIFTFKKLTRWELLPSGQFIRSLILVKYVHQENKRSYEAETCNLIGMIILILKILDKLLLCIVSILIFNKEDLQKIGPVRYYYENVASSGFSY